MSRGDLQDLKHRMMAALDDELEVAERKEIEKKISADPELRAEWRRLCNLKELTTMTTIKSPPDEQWDHYRHSVFHRLERGLGWLLVSVGATVLLCFGLWQAVQAIWADTSMPEYLKLAVFALGAGAIILFVSVAREKLFTHRHDPFKEIQR